MSEDIPESAYERAEMLQNILLAAVEGQLGASSLYKQLRLGFVNDPTLSPLLPSFVRSCRDLSSFWPYIKSVSPHWAPRRAHVREAMLPLLDHLEGINRSPIDAVASEVLGSFDPESVHVVWTKALDRRHADPEGAITIARTLLETVCKRILEETGTPYNDKDDLPDLYKRVATTLNIAPSQHTEDIFKRILGGATSVVEGLGSLRNKVSDAHGRGASMPVRVSPRHAQLAVNLAGAMATFIIETWLDRSS